MEGVAGVVDEDLVAPGAPVVGAALAADAEAAVLGVGLGGTGVVAHDDGAVVELYEVWDAVGGVVGVGDDALGGGPGLAHVGAEGDVDAGVLADGHQAAVLQLDDAGVAAAGEDGAARGGVPEDAGIGIGRDGGGAQGRGEEGEEESEGEVPQYNCGGRNGTEGEGGGEVPQ